MYDYTSPAHQTAIQAHLITLSSGNINESWVGFHPKQSVEKINH